MFREAILTLAVSSGLTLAVSSTPTAAADSWFIDAVKDNTVSGKAAPAMPYNLYFVEGGQVTYADAGGHHDSGTWRVNESGDVCLRWRKSTAPVGGCFRVTIDGHRMTLAKGSRRLPFVLRGDVTSGLR